MNIQFASDLHLEFSANNNFLAANPLQPVGDILILAGDIVPFHMIERHRAFFKFCSDHFEACYWIPGNHEYYHGELGNRTGHFKEQIESNVFLVNNYEVALDDTRIILSTLWSRISARKAPYIEQSLNDYHLIRDGEKRFSVERCNELFVENLAFIRTAIDKNTLEKCVVVTHHVPTFDHYPPEYLGSTINEAFAVNLNDFIESSRIDFWIYGHHHRNTSDFLIGKTKLLTNQLGYVQANEHMGFDLGKIIG